MLIILILIFAALAAFGLAFVCWPVWRHAGKGRALLAAAVAAFVLGIAGGCYLLVGHPEMALRALEPLEASNTRGLVSALALRMRQSPNDPHGWILLGRGYLSLRDPEDAADAFGHAIAVSPPAERPALFSVYGESLVAAGMGAVSPEAENAFRIALAGNPKDFAARYYLGEAYAERRDVGHALALWQSLLADAPPGAPWRAQVVDRMAMLRAASSSAPDIPAMVQGLADRLHASPNDPAGWQRLVRAYVVLGQPGTARAALAEARRALAANPAALAALKAEARALKLEK